jgi:hypothetical protein
MIVLLPSQELYSDVLLDLQVLLKFAFDAYLRFKSDLLL